MTGLASLWCDLACKMMEALQNLFLHYLCHLSQHGSVLDGPGSSSILMHEVALQTLSMQIFMRCHLHGKRARCICLQPAVHTWGTSNNLSTEGRHYLWLTREYTDTTLQTSSALQKYSFCPQWHPAFSWLYASFLQHHFYSNISPFLCVNHRYYT